MLESFNATEDDNEKLNIMTATETMNTENPETNEEIISVYDSVLTEMEVYFINTLEAEIKENTIEDLTTVTKEKLEEKIDNLNNLTTSNIFIKVKDTTEYSKKIPALISEYEKQIEILEEAEVIAKKEIEYDNKIAENITESEDKAVCNTAISNLNLLLKTIIEDNIVSSEKMNEYTENINTLVDGYNTKVEEIEKAAADKVAAATSESSASTSTSTSTPAATTQVLTYTHWDGTVYSAPANVNDLFYNQGHNFEGLWINEDMLWIDLKTDILYDANGNVEFVG